MTKSRRAARGQGARCACCGSKDRKVFMAWISCSLIRRVRRWRRTIRLSNNLSSRF
jgi:hypothetical protein